MIKLNLGCGKDIKKGFVNCDIVDQPGVDKVFDCVDLSVFPDNSADLIFCHSFFEHLYTFQQLPFLNECSRVLKESGYLVILGIPDFSAIAKAYVRANDGIEPFGGTFNLYQAYRLTHGDYEGNGEAYIPQMHKVLFDAFSIFKLMSLTNFESYNIFHYNFPGEHLELALGIIVNKKTLTGNKEENEILKEFKEYLPLNFKL